MSKYATSKSSLHTLRAKAESAIVSGERRDDAAVGSIRDYIHELQVYQVELEMQADELRKTQLELIHSRDEYATLYDQAPIGYIALNLSGLILKTNQTFARMLQVEPELLIHRPLSQYVQLEDHPLFFAICHRATHAPQLRMGEVGFLRTDKSLFFGRLDITPQALSSTMEPHYRITVVDITEKRLAEQEKMRLEREILKLQKEDSLKRLAGGIAHNFNNLLTIIMGNIELVEELNLSGEQMRQCLADVAKASARAAELSTMMLTYLGFPPSQPTIIELSSTIQQILSVLQSTLHGPLHFSFTPSPQAIHINGDRTQIAHLINNLIENSVEAIGKEPGTITVLVYEDYFCHRTSPPSYHGERLKPGRYACIEIRDSGCGMEQATLEKAIDPFFTTHFTGRGLGLSAVWGIVHAHHGYFFLNSEPGKGTVARAFFPPAQPKVVTTSAVAAPLSASLVTAVGKTILLADDDQIVRKIGKLLLEDEGYHILEANGGHEAVALYRLYQQDIRCVVLDFAMPDLDGNLTLIELRKINPQVPVLLVSGFLKEQTVERFLTEKPNGFLQKPFNRDEFLQSVADMFAARP